MKAVCQSDEGDLLLIISGVSLGAALNEDSPLGRVLWRTERWLGQPRPLHRLLESREWDEMELPDAELRELLSNLKRIDGPGIDKPWE